MVLTNAALLVVALAAQDPGDPADLERSSSTASPAITSANAQPLRVVVLDTNGGDDLDEREADVLTSLVAMRLEKNASFEVLSGRSLDAAARSCRVVACMGDVASSLHADFVVFVETAMLGDALVVTLHAYDTAHHRFVRDALSARQRGELPERIGAFVDGMLAPLMVTLPATRRPDVRARYEQTHLEVCSDPRGWFFCDGTHRAVTENEFVRRYRGETNRHDLDKDEVDRNPTYEPWLFLVGGGATALATVGLTVGVGSTQAGQEFARQSDDAWIVLPVLGLSTALALVVYGAVELDDTPHMNDGNELDHLLDEETARQAVRSYDDALLLRLQREASSQPG